MKYFFIIIFAIAFGLGFFFFKNSPQPTAFKPPIVKNQLVAKAEEIALPKKIIIKKLGINSNIESVGLDEQKRMDVPIDPNNAGWYNLGYKPGELGSAVIAGHVDTPTGTPAIFYNLSTLTNNDLISIEDANGQIHNFLVYDNTSYNFDKLPLNDIFASTDGKKLNLITCDGAWNKSNKNYSKRRVVYAMAKD